MEVIFEYEHYNITIDIEAYEIDGDDYEWSFVDIYDTLKETSTTIKSLPNNDKIVIEKLAEEEASKNAGNAALDCALSRADYYFDLDR